MGDVQKKSTEECWRELEKLHADIGVPGYWDNLEQLCDQWASAVSVSTFWKKVAEDLTSWRTEYRARTGGELLVREGLADFSGKLQTRIRSKLDGILRRSPDRAADAFLKDGPAIPTLNDLVRTRVACRFIDGVEFLADKLVALGDAMDMPFEREREGRVEGYFAQHLSFHHDVVYKFAGGRALGSVCCEIQVATELATVMWDTSHAIYAQVRESRNQPEDWQWNPKDPRFVTNQLGHMMHLADGLLVQLRDLASQSKGRRGQG